MCVRLNNVLGCISYPIELRNPSLAPLPSTPPPFPPVMQGGYYLPETSGNKWSWNYLLFHRGVGPAGLEIAVWAGLCIYMVSLHRAVNLALIHAHLCELWRFSLLRALPLLMSVG